MVDISNVMSQKQSSSSCLLVFLYSLVVFTTQHCFWIPLVCFWIGEDVLSASFILFRVDGHSFCKFLLKNELITGTLVHYFWFLMYLSYDRGGTVFNKIRVLWLNYFFLSDFFKIRKRIQKDNITFHANNTVSYKEYRSYYFEPSMSTGNESDVVTIPNMLVLVSLLFKHFPHRFCYLIHSQSVLANICVFRVQQWWWNTCLFPCVYSSAPHSRLSKRGHSWLKK